MPLASAQLGDLEIIDEAAYADLDIWRRLRARVEHDRVRFSCVPSNSALSHWGHTALLNHAVSFRDGPSEILHDRVVPADAIMHTAWHHVVAQHLGAPATDTADGMLLGESVASAFDLYLIGNMLGRDEELSLLETQVPALSEVAMESGLDEDEFAVWLASVAEAPEASFEALRALLFDVSTDLLRAESHDHAADMLEAHTAHPMFWLLPRYEVAIWVLYVRAYGRGLVPDSATRDVDRALRSADSSFDVLTRWI